MVNVKFLKSYFHRPEYQYVPPEDEEEIALAPELINAVVGWDCHEDEDGKTVQTYDLQFKGCDPSLILTVSQEFFCSLPKKQQRALIQELHFPNTNESETILQEDGDSVTELV